MIPPDNREESRGQVLILIGIIVALAVIASAVALTANMQASVDRADGVSKTPTPATSMMTDIDDSISDSIVTANRNSGSDVESLVNEQNELLSNSAAYRGHELSVELQEEVDGTRLSDSEDQLPSDTYMRGVTGPFSGGISLDTAELTDATGDERTRIETDTHRIYINVTDDGLARADVELPNGETETYETQTNYPYVDLGAGSFDGFEFESYDQSQIENITVGNTDDTHGTVELVVEGDMGGSEVGDELLREDAVFGVVYTVTATSDRQQTTTTRMATHSPIRGDNT